MRFSGPRAIVYLVLAVIGLYVGIATRAVFSEHPRARETTSLSAAVKPADPTLSPADVVRLQLDSLRNFRKDESSLLQCFVLASPSNRAVTGPLDRFAAMVQSPRYRALLAESPALVGSPVIRGNQAMVLVTVLDGNGDASVFRFFLSQQTDPEYKDCWMTDAVDSSRGQEAPLASGSAA